MVEHSTIEWTDHTYNPWWGCTKVSPACDHCYAEGWARRTGHHSARIGEEVTLKRYERTGAHTVEFQPESTNPEHKPIRVDARTDDVASVGIVVGAIIGTRRGTEV